MSMARDTEICCGLEPEDLGHFHNEVIYDNSLPVGVSRSGLKGYHRIAGVAAHVSSCKWVINVNGLMYATIVMALYLCYKKTFMKLKRKRLQRQLFLCNTKYMYVWYQDVI